MSIWQNIFTIIVQWTFTKTHYIYDKVGQPELELTIKTMEIFLHTIREYDSHTSKTVEVKVRVLSEIL